MPTIVRESGFRVVIYPNDHEPVHVHVFKQGGEIKLDISQDEPELIEKYGKLSNRDVKLAYKIVSSNLEVLRRRWKEITDARSESDPRC